jgi:hypothetical protein
MDDKVCQTLLYEIKRELVPQTGFHPARERVSGRAATILSYQDWLAQEGKSLMLDGHTKQAERDYKFYVEQTKTAFEKRRTHEKIEKEETDRAMAQVKISNVLTNHESQIGSLTRVVDEQDAQLRECLSCIEMLTEQVQYLLELSEGAESPQTQDDNPLCESECSSRVSNFSDLTSPC